MKFNVTHAVVGLVALLLVVKMTRKAPATSAVSNGQGVRVNAAQWWSYAGSWQ